ncbi:MAG: hypothetical protein KDH20_14000, partial [Rhodocyclaceae bacterium]|nr:hypothetical protein [Rhodocyclaceae bacterium]
MRPVFRIPTSGILFALVVLAGVPQPAAGETVVHTETFATLQFADTTLTSAAWDTVAGNVHLHAQGLLELDGLATGGQSWAVAMRGDVVYVALGSADAVAVVDAADPANL